MTLDNDLQLVWKFNVFLKHPNMLGMNRRPRGGFDDEETVESYTSEGEGLFSNSPASCVSGQVRQPSWTIWTCSLLVLNSGIIEDGMENDYTPPTGLSYVRAEASELELGSSLHMQHMEPELQSSPKATIKDLQPFSGVAASPVGLQLGPLTSISLMVATSHGIRW